MLAMKVHKVIKDKKNNASVQPAARPPTPVTSAEALTEAESASNLIQSVSLAVKQDDSHGSSVDASVANVKNDQVKNVAGTGVEGGNEGNIPTPKIYTLGKTADSNIADKTEDEQTDMYCDSTSFFLFCL